MEPVEYLRGLRRRWRVILAAVLIGMIGAWLTSSALPASTPGGDSRYKASVLILDARGQQFGTQPVAGVIANASLDAIAAVVPFEAVANRAVEQLGDEDADPGELAVDVEATTDTATGILTITATADVARRAERVADAFAVGLRKFLVEQRRHTIDQHLRELQHQLNALPPPISDRNDPNFAQRSQLQNEISSARADRAAPLGLQTLDRTDASEIDQTGISAPSSTAARVLIGGILGLFGGIALALILERFDRRITSWRTAEDLFRFPLLAEVPKLRRRGRGLAVVDHPTSAGADAFRLLASTVLQAIREKRALVSEGNGYAKETPVLAITSAIRAEGKSLVSANLSAALGEQGLRCIVISCDLRSPTVHRYFDVPATPGVTDAIRDWDGEPGFRRVLASTKAPLVSVIPGGSPSPRSAAILAGDEIDSIVRYAKASADVVILDTPAILLSADAVPQVASADSVLVVARSGKTTIEAAERVNETLARLDAPVVGFALNGSRSVGSRWRRSAYTVIPDSAVTKTSDLAAARTGEV